MWDFRSDARTANRKNNGTPEGMIATLPEGGQARELPIKQKRF
jgi:hypothetical protein